MLAYGLASPNWRIQLACVCSATILMVSALAYESVKKISEQKMTTSVAKSLVTSATGPVGPPGPAGVQGAQGPDGNKGADGEIPV